ncbi:MAG: PASTA domain-containing protein [Deltaproteobacteria bacterium]|nr:PASTA domain-containing protein [Deltaproteobacteria bacterium]
MIVKIAKIAGMGFVFVLVAGISAYLTLTLIIKSEDTVIVPHLEGKDVVYALEILTELELNTKVKGSEYTGDIPKNHVVFQDPQPGSEIKKGRDIRIILSKGPKTFAMPHLLGLSVQQANIILDENDMCKGELARTYDRVVEKDLVLAQVPAPGTVVSRGSCIDLLVSLGRRPAAFKMPDLAGLTLEDALQSIERYRLVIGELKSTDQPDKPRNTVVEHEPVSGQRVVTGSIVRLLINRETQLESAGDSSGTATGNLFSYRLDSGFLNRHIRVRINTAGFTNDLFDDFVKAGEEIWLLIPTDREATVFLYENDKLIKTQRYNTY